MLDCFLFIYLCLIYIYFCLCLIYVYLIQRNAVLLDATYRLPGT